MIIAPYSWLMLGGIALTLSFWSRLVRRDKRLFVIYLSALVGAFAGAKIIYLLAEGYRAFGTKDMWLQLATGKSILGGLLGGYLAVEIAKPLTGYVGVTGDWFALVVPLGVFIGRIGCWLHGCCNGIACSPAWFTVADVNGVARWPSVPAEMLFNVAFLGIVLLLRKRQSLPGQHFHLYLISYGIFRFFHEFLRDEPRLVGPFSGYHFAALAVLGLGIAGFARRRWLSADLGRICAVETNVPLHPGPLPGSLRRQEGRDEGAVHG